jgi:hypothetical protein
MAAFHRPHRRTFRRFLFEDVHVEPMVDPVSSTHQITNLGGFMMTLGTLKKALLIPVLLLSVQASAYYEGEPIDLPAPEYAYKGRFVFEHVRHSGDSPEQKCNDYRDRLNLCEDSGKYKCGICEKEQGDRAYFFIIIEKIKK